MKEKELLDYFDEFVKDLRNQLKADDKKWGDTWKHRDRDGQLERLKPNVRDMFDRIQYGTLTNEERRKEYLMLCGNAFINWIREKYPNTYKKDLK